MEIPLVSLLLTFGCILVSTFARFCPKVKDMEDVDLKRLGGVWWVWEEDSNKMAGYVEPQHTCHSSRFYPSEDGKTFSVINDYVLNDGNGKEGHARYTWSTVPRVYKREYPLYAIMAIQGFGTKWVNLFILGTDYDRFLVVHLCKVDYRRTIPIEFKSTLTLVRNKDLQGAEATEIATEVDAVLVMSQLDRIQLGLKHGGISTKDCVEPNFPSNLKNPLDLPTLKAHVRAISAHAKHVLDEANALMTIHAIGDDQWRHYARDVKALTAELERLATH